MLEAREEDPTLARIVRTLLPIATLIGVLSTISRSGDARAGGESLSEFVNRAVDRGVEWMWTQQEPDGSFRGAHVAEHPMGQTALALLALHKSNASPDDPRFQRGIQYLRYLSFEKTYSTGITLMLLDGLGMKEHEPWITKGAQFLLDKINPNVKFWAYPNGTPDFSNTQYAVLGLYAASNRGFRISPKVWLDLLDALKRAQRPSGGFPYRVGDPPSGSMTLAGIAIAAICFEELQGNSRLESDRREYEDMLRRAYAWYRDRFNVQWNPEGDEDGRNIGNLFYYLYGLERLGNLTRQKTIAGHDWYDEGARYILSLQAADGSWTSVGGRDFLTDTSFALLFLRRASTTPSLRIDLVEGTGSPTAPTTQASPETSPARVDPDIPFVRNWLLLGPFEFKEDNGIREAFIDEKTVAPFAGFKTGKRSWELYESPTDNVDLSKALRGGDHRVAYAVTYVYSLVDGAAVLWIGSDDGGAALFNGEQVIYQHIHGVNPPDRFRAPVRLERGLNRLLLKIENHTGSWGFHARLSGPEGRPLSSVAIAPVRHFDAAKVREAIAVPLEDLGYEQIPADGTARSFDGNSEATPGTEPAKAFDGNPKSWWASDSPKTSLPKDLGMEWDRLVEISGVELDFARSKLAPAADGYQFQEWNGSSWQGVEAKVKQRDGASWYATFPTISTKRFRVFVTKMPPDADTSAARPAIHEMRFYRKSR